MLRCFQRGFAFDQTFNLSLQSAVVSSSCMDARRFATSADGILVNSRHYWEKHYASLRHSWTWTSYPLAFSPVCWISNGERLHLIADLWPRACPLGTNLCRGRMQAARTVSSLCLIWWCCVRRYKVGPFISWWNRPPEKITHTCENKGLS